MDFMKTILDLFTQFVLIGGGLWLVWGLIVAAGGFNEQDGPTIKKGIWQIAGGGLILAGAALFKNVVIG
jgi:hypothetical protein